MNLRGGDGYCTSNGCRMTGILLLQNSKLKLTHKIFAIDFYPLSIRWQRPRGHVKTHFEEQAVLLSCTTET